MIEYHRHNPLLCFQDELIDSICIESFSCSFTTTDCLHMFHCSSEAKPGHVAVDALKLIRIDGIGFMPDANSPVSANSLVEFFPWSQVRIGRIAGKAFQILKGAPVLDHHRSVEVPEEFSVQES